MKKSYAINTSYLARLMKNQGWNQKTLAKAVPCSSNMLHRWVNGKSQITARKLIQLAKALRVDACSLLETDDRRTIKYLRDLVNKKIEHDKTFEDDLPLVDIPTLLAIVKTLGYNETSNLKVAFNPDDFDFKDTEAEKQVRDLIDG